MVDCWAIRFCTYIGLWGYDDPKTVISPANCRPGANSFDERGRREIEERFPNHNAPILRVKQ